MFSTATFHWVRDHNALFAEIFSSLRPGGRLFAQCGGGPNLAGAHALAEEVMRLRAVRSLLSWIGRVCGSSATADVAADRLHSAGFIEVHTSLEPAPTTLADEASYREFVTTVIYNPHLAMLPEGSLRARFIDEVTSQAARQDPPFTLDYWRLNLDARRPPLLN